MSHLYISDPTGKEFKMNVTQFRSPMNAAINSVQTRTMLQHFPIRCGQPDINFTVQYISMNDKHSFEAFVREHQVYVQSHKDPEITLWWPERNIENWTGYITSYTVTERRFETAPSATFGVSLVKSMMSEKTNLSSRAADITSILGEQIPAWLGSRDLILVRPTFTNTTQPVNPQDVPGQNNQVVPTGPLAPPGIGR